MSTVSAGLRQCGFADLVMRVLFFFFSSRRRHTRLQGDWSSDVCSSDLLSLEELQARYARLDPAGATQIDLQNSRRLVRAIEVCVLTGQPFSSFRNEWKTDAAPINGVLLLRERSEERRVGKECRSRWSPY